MKPTHHRQGSASFSPAKLLSKTHREFFENSVTYFQFAKETCIKENNSRRLQEKQTNILTAVD